MRPASSPSPFTNTSKALDYGRAHVLSGTLLALSFSMLVFVYGLNRKLRWIR